jgi:hypothetical protein
LTVRPARTTGLPLPDPTCSSDCIPLARNCEELIIPITGTPHMSDCVPGGTWVCGYMRIRNSFSQTTCGTKVVSEVSSFGKICVPGLGEFKTSEVHLNSNTVTLTSSEILVVDDSRYRNVNCGESYRMIIKLRLKIGLDGTVSRCEAIDIDCPACCGN